MKRTNAVFMIAVSLLLVFMPLAASETVFAQTSGYTITQINHQVAVTYTGQAIIQDTVYVSGSVANGFLIGFPAQYSSDIISAVAYDSSNVYSVNLGVQLPGKSGFYGAEVDFNGQSPSVFTVAFVMSNVLSQTDTGDFTLNFPAYPALTQTVGTCNVTLSFPSTALVVTIGKSDGSVSGSNYVTSNLPAYTYSPAGAAFQVTNGTIQLANVESLNRQVSVDPTGKVTVSDSYRIVDNSTLAMTNFVLNVPKKAGNIEIKDEVGNVLQSSTSSIMSTSDAVAENATLSTSVSDGQATTLTASYSLPSAMISGSKYTLSNFQLFPDINAYVAQATLTINPPQGASITTPKVSGINLFSSLTRTAFQDTFTLTANGISHLYYILPQTNTIQFAYNYNAVWVSFMPTLWLSLVAVVGCIGAFVYQKRKPTAKAPSAFRRTTKSSTPKPVAAPSTGQQAKSAEPAVTQATAPAQPQRITGESIREFTDSYEDRKRLNAELRSLDTRAQKGKIPRRQYKVQRSAIEARLETLMRNANKMKETLRNTSGYSDLVRQLDSAEEDLTEAEENIKNLEDQQSRGEIALEAYKKTIGDYQKRRDKAESTLNGILLRLREKAR